MSFLVRRRSRRFAWALVFGFLLVIVSAAPVLAGSAPAPPESDIAPASLIQSDEGLPSGTDIARGLAAAARDEVEAERRLESPSVAAVRAESLKAYEDLDPNDAADLLRSKFAHVLATLNADPARLLSSNELKRALPGGTAGVVSIGGEPQILDAGIPVEVAAKSGTVEQVDLSLVEGADGSYGSKNPLIEVGLPSTADGAIEVGDAGLGIRQLGADGSADARLFGDKSLLYPEADTDTDLLVAPISRGVEIFNQLRSARSPEELRFQVVMPKGADLVADGSGGAEVRRGSEMLAEIPFPFSVDAQGADVPTTIEVAGDTLVVKVPHRAADFAYPILVDPVLNAYWYDGASWYNGANLGVLTDGTWQWGANAGWVYGSSSCIYACWGSGRGLYVTGVNGTKGSGEFGQWSYTPPGATSFLTQAWIYPFFRDNHGCSKAAYGQPHDYSGFWTGSAWAPLNQNHANDYGSSYLNGGGRSLIVGLGTAGGIQIPCWRDIVAGGVSVLVTDPEAPVWTTAPSAPDTWTDTAVVPVSGTAYDPGLGVKYFNLYKTPSNGKTYDFIGNAERACSGLHSSPCGASWSPSVTNYNPAALPNGVNLLSVFAYDALGIEHHSAGKPVRVKVDHAKPKLSFSGDLFTKEPEEFKGLVTATDGSSASLATAQSGVKSVKIYVDGVLAGRFPDEVSPPACYKPQEGFNIASCKIEAPVELTESLSGTHTFKAVAFDSLNHEEKKEVTLDLPVDSASPSLSVTGTLKDADGLWVKPEELSASLKAEDAGTGIAKVELLIDGKTVGSASTEECYEGACKLFEKTFKVALGSYAAGAHTVKAIVKDGAGNEESSSWTVHVDPADPTLDPLVTPDLPEGWTPQSSSFKLEYAASDAHSGIKRIEVRRPSIGGGSPLVTNPVNSACTTSCPATVSGSTTLSTDEMAQGADVVTVRAYDAAGHVSSSQTVVVLVDREEPEITKATGPLFADPAELIGIVTDLELELTDEGGGFHSLELLLDGEPVEVLGEEEIEELGGVESCSDEVCELEFSMEPLVGGGADPGEHDVELVVTDRAGHSVSIDNEVTIDTKVPDVGLSGSLMNTLGTSLDGKPVRVDVSADDGNGEYDAGMASLEVAVDGEPLEGFALSGDMVAVSDEGNDRIQIFDEDGEFVRAFGSNGSEDGNLDRPVGIAIDDERNVWVADAGNDRVQKFSEEGDHLQSIGSAGDGDGEFDRPEGIAIDAAGNIWVGDTGNGRLQVLDSDGDFVEVVCSNGPEPGEVGEPVGLGTDPAGAVWVADRQYDRVVKFSADGDFVRQFGSSGNSDGKLDQPESVDVDSDGTIWVADQGNARVQGFDDQGEYLSQFGSKAEFSHPAGIATDAQGRVWVADSNRGRDAAPVPATREPVAALSFNEGAGKVAHDAAGNNDGVISGAQWSEAGKFGSALKFDGIDDLVTVADANTLDFTNAFTLEAWIRPEARTEWGTAVGKEGPKGTSYILYAEGNGGGPVGYVQTVEGEVNQGTSQLLPLDAWSHLAFTYDGDDLRLYVDGSLIGTTPAAEIEPSDGPLQIGGYRYWGEEDSFKGLIDEVRLYDEVLSEAEIGEDMDKAIGPPAPRADPVAAYAFSEGAGEAAHDTAGNNDGTINGAQWSEAGKFGSALKFDGIDDLVTIADADSLDFTDAFTLGAWVKPSEANEWSSVITKERNGSLSYQLHAEGGNEAPVGFVADGKDFAGVEPENPLPVGQWSHLAMTSDGEHLSLYVNGELRDTRPGFAAAASDDDLQIGGNLVWGEEDAFKGLIDEVRLYDEALSAGEVAEDVDIAIGLTGERVQRWQISGEAGSFEEAFGSHGTGDGAFENPGDIAVASSSCGAGVCTGQTVESFVYDPAVWGSGPRTVTVTATDEVGNYNIDELRVNEPLNVVAPSCPSGEVATLSGGDENGISAVVTDIETTIPEALEPSKAAPEAGLEPAVVSESAGVSLNEMGIDVVASETGGGIEDDAAGSFTVGQAACLQPLETSGAALDPVIVNNTAVVYPNSAPDTDTVVRPTAAGTAIVQRVRGEDAPSEFSWKVQLETGQELVELEGGGIAVLDPEGIDLDPESVPPAPEEDMLLLTDAETQVAQAEHDLAAANEELTGEVTMVIPAPMVVDDEDKVTPGILRIVGATVVVAELPPGTLVDAEALIILMSPAAEPESMCMSVMARAPQYAAAACADEEIENDAEEGIAPPFSLKELAQTSEPALNAYLLPAIEQVEQSGGASTSGIEYPGGETPMQKLYCEGHRERCKKYRTDGGLAVIAQNQLFNNPTGDSHMANAFKHSLWNALMRVSYWNGPGVRQGWVWAKFHETPEYWSTYPYAARRKASRMDMLNNTVGLWHAAGNDLSSCEVIRYKSVRAHFIGSQVEPPAWANRTNYNYSRPVYRKLKSFVGNPLGLRVTPSGKHCDEIRVGWGPLTINPFDPPFGVRIE